jgi:hypothetical protein
MKVLGKNESDSASGNSTARAYSIWPSVVIILINFVIGKSTRYFSSFERPHTVTAYNISVALKLTLAMFVNTAAITLIVNYD